MDTIERLLRTILFAPPLSPVAIGVAAVGGLVSLLTWRPLVRVTGWRPVPTLLALLALAAVLALTLAPGSDTAQIGDNGLRACLTPLHLRARLAAVRTSPEGLLNLALLVPLGVFAVLAMRRVRWPLLLVVVLPLTIELVQTQIPGRVCSGIDWVTNAAGGVLGVAIGGCVLLLTRRGRPTRPGGGRA